MNWINSWRLSFGRCWCKWYSHCVCNVSGFDKTEKITITKWRLSKEEIERSLLTSRQSWRRGQGLTWPGYTSRDRLVDRQEVCLVNNRRWGAGACPKPVPAENDKCSTCTGSWQFDSSPSTIPHPLVTGAEILLIIPKPPLLPSRLTKLQPVISVLFSLVHVA